MNKLYNAIEKDYRNASDIFCISTINLSDETIIKLIKTLHKKQHLFLFDSNEQKEKFEVLINSTGLYNENEILNFNSQTEIQRLKENNEELENSTIYSINKNQIKKLKYSNIILMTIDKLNSIVDEFNFSKNLKVIYFGNKIFDKTNHFIEKNNLKCQYGATLNQIQEDLIDEIGKSSSNNKKIEFKTLGDSINSANLLNKIINRLNIQLSKILNVELYEERDYEENCKNVLKLYETFISKIRNKIIKEYNLDEIKSHYFFFRNLLLTKKAIYNNKFLYSIEFKNIHTFSKLLKITENPFLIISNHINITLLKSLMNNYKKNIKISGSNYYDINNGVILFKSRYKNSPKSSYSKTSTFWIDDDKNSFECMKENLLSNLLKENKVNIITHKNLINKFEDLKEHENLKITYFNSPSIESLNESQIYLIIGNVNLDKYNYQEYSYYSNLTNEEIKSWFINHKNFELLNSINVNNKLILFYGVLDLENESELDFEDKSIFQHHLDCEQLYLLVKQFFISKKDLNLNINFTPYTYFNVDEIKSKESIYFKLKEYLKPAIKRDVGIETKNYSVVNNENIEVKNNMIGIYKRDILYVLQNKIKRRIYS